MNSLCPSSPPKTRFYPTWRDVQRRQGGFLLGTPLWCWYNNDMESARGRGRAFDYPRAWTVPLLRGVFGAVMIWEKGRMRKQILYALVLLWLMTDCSVYDGRL
jgi:hypothetical protein